jgi:hypothetical protein
MREGEKFKKLAFKRGGCRPGGQRSRAPSRYPDFFDFGSDRGWCERSLAPVGVGVGVPVSEEGAHHDGGLAHLSPA